MSLEAATWVTAAATVILAAFAIVTAWYARKAFREQSREVAAIEQQLRLQQEQSGREQAERRRAQASLVYMAIEPRPFNANPGEMRDAACVYNTSQQPVYDITLILGTNADQRVPVLLPRKTHVWHGIGTAYMTGQQPFHIGFRDRAGVRWLLRPDGDLRPDRDLTE